MRLKPFTKNQIKRPNNDYSDLKYKPLNKPNNYYNDIIETNPSDDNTKKNYSDYNKQPATKLNHRLEKEIDTLPAPVNRWRAKPSCRHLY